IAMNRNPFFCEFSCRPKSYPVHKGNITFARNENSNVHTSLMSSNQPPSPKGGGNKVGSFNPNSSPRLRKPTHEVNIQSLTISQESVGSNSDTSFFFS